MKTSITPPPPLARTLTGVVGLLLIVAAPAPAEDRAEDVARQAFAAYQAGDPATCLRLYREALEAGRESATSPYNAACCAALAGDTESAFELLRLAAERGYREADHLTTDSDLNSLHGAPEWAGVVAAVEANVAAYRASVHGELYDLYQHDQGDRRAENPDWTELSERDRKRRERVFELVEAGELEVADDYFHAAMVLQHGAEPEHFKMAHDLARRAVELDPEHAYAKWLSAAAWDRYLWNTDQPQVYGTQFRRDQDGPWTVEPFDREAVSDEERRAMNVPTVAETLERLEALNADIETEETTGEHDTAGESTETGEAAAARDYGSSFLRDYDRASGKLLQLAEAIPAEKYRWRPTPEVRSVSEVFIHVALANAFLARTAAGIEPPAALGRDAEKTVTKKEEVIAALETSQDLVRRAVAARAGEFEEEVEFFWGPAPVRDVFLQMAAHSHEHLGQMIAYARLAGVAPPWSRGGG